MSALPSESFEAFKPNATCLPFLKWAGGKRWLFRRYKNLFPNRIERLIDPFIGGGSSVFMLGAESAIISDANADLITTYRAIRDHPSTVARRLKHYQFHHNTAFYYQTRLLSPKDEIEVAARFLYLNRTCWNGLYRVNLKGQFNVPKGTKSKVFISHAEFAEHARILSRSQILECDFEDVIARARKGDVVFADPPYFEKDGSDRFVKYNRDVFSWQDQLRLCDALVAARRRGASCFITNSNHESLVTLYGKKGTHHTLTRRSVLAGSSAARRSEKEILIEISL